MYHKYSIYSGFLDSRDMVNRSKIYTIVMNPDLHKNLQRISLEQDTNVSAIIRKASEAYLHNYLQQKEVGEG